MVDLPGWSDLFHGYDIRGRYPELLGDRAAYMLGRSLARALHGPFVVGRDVRSESHRIASAVQAGLAREGARAVFVGIAPTPGVCFLARNLRRFGVSVTPSHNAVGYAGLKAFTPTGRLLDREWTKIHRVYDQLRAAPLPSERPGRDPQAGSDGDGRRTRRDLEPYLVHLTEERRSRGTFVVDARGGAASRVGPAALRRMGARVVELRPGFSPDFFGRSPEPRAGDSEELGRTVRATEADAGFAFDGDGDRCLVFDRRGRVVSPEAISLLLYDAFSAPRAPLVASWDASRALDRRTRTVRSNVGGRHVVRTMRRAKATVGMELSGHFYLSRYGSDSDGILVACAIAHLLDQEPGALETRERKIGAIHRGSFTRDYPTYPEARRAYRALCRARHHPPVRGLDGLLGELSTGWYLIRRSGTQPSLRFTYEARSARRLPPLERQVRRLAELAQPDGVGRDRQRTTALPAKRQARLNRSA